MCRRTGVTGGHGVKRTLDIVVSVIGLLLVMPVMLLVAGLVWCGDRQTPFYAPWRIGRGYTTFRMFKFRSMVPGADRSGVDSTRAGDPRITPVGGLLRRFKLDEIPQLVNVLRGEMSLVGPRPQVAREVRLYTQVERRLLDVRPGITDLSSVVFSDLAEILRSEPDADVAYNQLVRPGKSLLGLFYIDHRSLRMDLWLIALTAIAIVSRPLALRGVQRLLVGYGAPQLLVDLASRRHPLVPMPPPGSNRIVVSREAVSDSALLPPMGDEIT